VARSRTFNAPVLTDFAKRGRRPSPEVKKTLLLKDALILAADKIGQDGKGKHGLVGYLMWLAQVEPATYGSLLGKVIPLQTDQTDPNKTYTQSEALAELRARGLPPPVSLTDAHLPSAPSRPGVAPDQTQVTRAFASLADGTAALYAGDGDAALSDDDATE
jgi:hypothetical protein